LLKWDCENIYRKEGSQIVLIWVKIEKIVIKKLKKKFNKHLELVQPVSEGRLRFGLVQLELMMVEPMLAAMVEDMSRDS
jgi:hypothetical protein